VEAAGLDKLLERLAAFADAGALGHEAGDVLGRAQPVGLLGPAPPRLREREPEGRHVAAEGERDRRRARERDAHDVVPLLRVVAVVETEGEPSGHQTVSQSLVRGPQAPMSRG